MHGLLLSFLSEVPTAFVPRPPNYTPGAVASTARRYWNPDAGPPPRRAGGVNLILYPVESFVDPNDLGLRYSADPIPNFRALGAAHTAGHVIVPEDFGGSANTEFELLTGMSTGFLPERGLAYRQYLRHPIPSLPRTLHDAGYGSVVIQAGPRYFFDRERAYKLLGFDRAVWQREVPGVETTPRGNWPTDHAMVRAIIEASRGPRPFFIFAFPASSHSPYNFGTYRNSRLRVLDSASLDPTGEVKEYINRVREADSAIGTLIEYFSRRPDSTIIVLLGDHLPPLTERSRRPFSAMLARTAGPERSWKPRRAPLVVWANFPLPRTKLELSTNALPAYLLEQIGVPASEFLAVSDSVRRVLPVLAQHARDAEGHSWPREALPADLRALVADYWLLEYDLLLGKQYALRRHLALARSR
jgi:hypothetical protein